MDQKTIQDRRWFILGVLVLSLLVVVLDNTILNVALKTIALPTDAKPVSGLGASQSQLEWAINSYTLVFAGLLFTWGVMGDRLGRRRLLMAGMVVFGAGSVLSAFSQNPGQLIGFRAIMGIGGAAVMPATLSIITNVFEPHERGRAIAIWAGFSGLAIAIGPITGGLLLKYFWWGSVFLVNVPIVALAIVGILALVPESKDPRPQRVDPLGVFLSIAGLVLLVYGIIRGGQYSDFSKPEVWATMAGGVLLLALFVVAERRTDHPSLDVRLFRNPSFSAASGAVTLTFFALMGSTFFLVFYLQSVRGYTPLQSGLLLLPVAVGIAVFAPRSATMVKRFGAKAVCATGLLMVTASFAAYLFLQIDTPLWVIELIFFVQGAGMGNVMAPATESIMSTLPRERAGAGSAVNNTVRQVGGALGVAILGSLLSAVYRSDVRPHLAGLPDVVRARAGESVEATLAVARAAHAPQLVRPAQDAFISAMHVTAIGSAGVAFLGVVVVLLFLPGRAPGRHEQGVALGRPAGWEQAQVGARD